MLRHRERHRIEVKFTQFFLATFGNPHDNFSVMRHEFNESLALQRMDCTLKRTPIRFSAAFGD
ncbi:hypothetical protein C4552_01635 [Candidatus Parcubacteria bacterium]|nr:MAG: hypothetical protein C4552_01635 [Candidatus Parcubacteria bacterium]